MGVLLGFGCFSFLYAAPKRFVQGALKRTVCVSRNLCEPEPQVRMGLAGQPGVLLLQKKGSMLQAGRQCFLPTQV